MVVVVVSAESVVQHVAHMLWGGQNTHSFPDEFLGFGVFQATYETHVEPALLRCMFQCNYIRMLEKKWPVRLLQWKCLSLFNWCSHRTTHKAICHMFSIRSAATWRKCSSERCSLNRDHRHHGRHSGAIHTCSGCSMIKWANRFFLPDVVLRSPCSRPNRRAWTFSWVHCLVNFGMSTWLQTVHTVHTFSSF